MTSKNKKMTFAIPFNERAGKKKGKALRKRVESGRKRKKNSGGAELFKGVALLGKAWQPRGPQAYNDEDVFFQ